MIDFPASPTNGQQFSANGVTWTWDGFKWVPAGAKSGGVYLPLAGGTMLGDITLVGDPTAPLHPVTKQMLDKQSSVSHDNRIINGDMRIDQRNNGASGTAINNYTIDRWKFGATQSGKLTWQRGGPTNVWSAAIGFTYAMSFTSMSAFAPAASDYFQLYQHIEGDMLGDFAWGTASAQPVTLSFWAFSNLTGTFSGCVGNDTGTRSYPFTFSLPVASTWVKVAVTIPGEPTGTWVLSGSVTGAIVHFDLGAGSTYRAPAGAWAAGNYQGANGAVSIVATNNAQFYVTGVKLEVGSVATPFNRQSLAKSMIDCQRYYQAGNFGLQGTAIAGGSTVGYEQTLAVVMRASPTMVIASEASTTNMAARSITADSPSHIRPSGTAANNFSWLGTFTASAEL